MPEASPYWEQLFANEQGSAKPEEAYRVPMQVVHRQGYPFLLLPQPRKAAQTTLGLYAPQTAKARLARMVLQLVLGTPARKVLRSVLVPVHRSAPLAEMVAQLGLRGSGEKLSPFGVLAGNPATPGQRFLLLVFDKGAKPMAVVKTGLSARARELVEKENRLLVAAAAKPGVPRLKEALSGPVCAFALDFYAGHSPRAPNQSPIRPLLSSWLKPRVSRTLSETKTWQSLEASAGGGELTRVAGEKLKHARFSSALQHGDFAPWNIKVGADGRWTVLDWERGDLEGVPAWDWFHYVLQPAILVERRDTGGLAVCAREMLAAAEFRTYAQEAGISGMERELLLGYLLHMLEVVKPSEGVPQTRALLAALLESSKAGAS